MTYQDRKPPTLTGQRAEVMQIIREYGYRSVPLYSLTLTGEFSIPEAAARIHELREMGFNILSIIHPEILYRGRVRRGVAQYVLGTPAWPRPGFFADDEEAA
ncbi:helix-turn-helix domain-containing protein [Chromobacterium sp. IIBBL 290-4]|uniref:helix-turn-helix domain-containing protein n=1 Tax=Chromobacterium sp. IIBBL 290-4 TaxID=2953890 RepID=UPI0020B64FFD|nr:helix-turn-helix domain-containing protein [Chromobacterium sp. IIBBL 290-4]UTH72511.1 helix-turn-helix domain-containing protein [Chromobacterium sp. IIBBL 290-4]